MDFGTLMNRLGRNGQIFVGAALLLFIDGFLPWYSVSFKGDAEFLAGASSSGNAWDISFGAWFPTILGLAAGVVVALAAMGSIKMTPLATWTLGTAASILAFIIILIRWLTYPSVPAVEKTMMDAGASFGTYVGLVLALVMAVFGYMAFAAAGGDVKNLGSAFQNQAQAPAGQGEVPPQG
jgi:hypothetical protein